MTQYSTSGPPPAIKNQEKDVLDTIERLERRVESQDRLIKNLETQLRRLKNEMQAAVNTFNSNHG